MHRRHFVKTGAQLALMAKVPAVWGHSEQLEQPDFLSMDFSDPSNEVAWRAVRALFPTQQEWIQFEHGYFSHAFLPASHLERERAEYIQSVTSFFMRREQEETVERVRSTLAGFCGWNAENVALTRNTTESMNIVILGFPWKPGDEIIIGNQDYGSMTEAARQAAARYGVRVRVADIPLLPHSDEEVVEAYLKHISKRTRLLHLTHMIHLTGQIIPLDKIIQAAREKLGEELFIAVDAAHAFAQVAYDWKNSEADAVGASLHKWMCAPIGLGMLYLKPSRIPQLWPLLGDTDISASNIRRFEHVGTRPVHTLEALITAITLHQLMGGIRNKENRLRYMQRSWTKEVEAIPGIRLLTSVQEPERSCALATLQVEGRSPDQLTKLLWDQYQIYTVAINHPVVQGVRITPHLSTSLEHTAALVSALREIRKA